MPKGKKKSKGKGKGKSKVKKDVLGTDGDSKKVLKTYERNCSMSNSQMYPGIKQLLKAAAEENKVITKFILESVQVVKENDLPVLLDPFLSALRQERYKHVKDLHIWDYLMSYEDMASLALILEKSIFPIRLLELLDCLIDCQTIPRLARSLIFCEQMTILVLDYNEFGDEGCKLLCAGLASNITLLSLSLSYCNLGVKSGTYLGHTVSNTAISELYLDGNELQTEGAIELIKLLVDQAELEAYQREEEAKRLEEEKIELANLERIKRYESGTEASLGSETEVTSQTEKGKKKKKKGKGKRKKKKRAPKGPPPVGPWLNKLHLADNGIDGYGDSGQLAPIICMRLFKKLLMNSKCFVELDLEDNSISELGGREILEGLTARKEAKLGACKVRTIHKMTADTFNAIVKLGSSLKKKGKRKGKKGKKKKK
ncbi:hypothetical protein Bpfe_021652 [Biomphalaria pfeifferi]|uniref:NACHT LRR and PYD domain-containing protein n=1 Tax=Biomphalaria pfeifferi TaxID=112525 RepID=A0AAD8B6F4_BIOPF|nr:hypothetical protein Bpfe_021652 [Biomphalaria pfeifferi]